MKERKPLRWLAISACEKTHMMFKAGEGHGRLHQEEILGVTESSHQLFLLDRFLKKTKLRKKDFNVLVVVQGPGSFSSVRVGCAIANGLALSLNIPVVGVKSQQWDGLEKVFDPKFFKKKNFHPVQPLYSKPPNITFPMG